MQLPSQAPTHTSDADAPADPSAWLSALVDGDISEQTQALQRASEEWAQSPATRQRWHTYHLIGDVMRSEELATSPAQDAAFLARLRQRLAQEPVVLAPAPVATPPRLWRQAWITPAAVAAGFMAVAGVLVVARLGQPGTGPADAAVLASKTTPALSLASTGLENAAASNNRELIRDARLDSYLRAHQAARGGGGAAAVPGGGLRNVDVTLPAGTER